MLSLRPEDRLTINEIINHPYITSDGKYPL